ncbi:Queuine tRNA-ribosyltransferase [Gloeophyllum trabeum ATCC 11539]|uniref:Queuine tRNA-ribosyltransferase catalytic subunit 1 n=1 Tax=Gloeophyllum trabeum (strain ATCC 11539 / FP-39264 / Madison 617) TaxID=670483 RepID=S7RRG1_GLOTA|nr:Queuine tRNA-ribosyltransferase [Gloeophyllum trabeum ATCC 11539]EPQ57230.1 Queuine tRNA-ribosyltransferase [Gloeophyllum trabeum ATCC 11539]
MPALQFEILATCHTTKARVSRMTLPHGVTALPAFMPVATQAAIKGLTPQQVESLGITLILNNTYHLNLRPGTKVLQEAGGAHKFQGWRHNLLTDSGGFQLVSLSKFTKITEEGALFSSPFTGEPTMLTPEESISIQHAIGADIMMQLDDVVSSLTTGPRVAEAMARSVRWLDRCIEYHEKSGRTDVQNLFAIVQGGLDPELRNQCLDEMIQRKDRVAGYAIGGLSGGEAKDTFWRIVKQCADKLPADKPRYCMGVGFAEDLLVCAALGVDMADCVFPTRTARFGVALTFKGPMNLKLGKHATEFVPIDENCPCPTCKGGTTRAMLHHIVTLETVAAHAVTMHNLTFQAQVMGGARDAILQGTFPDYLHKFFDNYFGDAGYPEWCVNALRSVGVDLLAGKEGAKIVQGDGARWEYSTTKRK